MEASVQITEKAANAFKSTIIEEDLPLDDTYLLMGARPGGCSGYKFTLDSTHDILPQDITFNEHGITVVVNKEMLDNIIGNIKIDYNDTNLVEQGFVFTRLANGITCGCGESFTPIKELSS